MSKMLNGAKDSFTPCDVGDCPYDAGQGYDCRSYCGLGVDESDYDYEDECDEGSECFEEASEEDWKEANKELADMMICHITDFCCGVSCEDYFECSALCKL